MSAYLPKDPALADHLAWLGYVQPEGLVVSAPALVDAQAIIDRAQLAELQGRFNAHISSLAFKTSDLTETQLGIENLQKFATEFLGWQYELLAGVDPSRPLPESLSISLPEFQETLRPTFAVARPPAQIENRKSEIVNAEWLLLVQSHPATVDLDKPVAHSNHNWHASPAKKFERLLRETGVSIGLLSNGTHFRLIYAPPKENSGSLTFPVGAMSEVSGRLILGAFHLLLNSFSLFNAPSDARLPALLQRSRDYQASVSEILAEQVLHALYELLRGFESADERVKGALLHELAAKDSHNIYGGLVTVLLRLVFTLFAEDRGLLPTGGLYVNHYSVRGLFERLRDDAERYPDTMDHRFGAWAQLLALFRVIHGGCQHPELKMPARAGHLFDPDRYPFLEGRASNTLPIGPLPLVSDGTIHRILEKLCILKGERVSYRTLDVEEIGSVYQTIMGFGVEAAAGTAIGLKGKRKNGGVPASPVIYLEQLLAVPAKDRAKWLKENADSELTGEADKKLKSASSVDDLLVALEKKIDRHATPGPVAKGGLVLQPGDERRRSGSHYTPRSFTEPIVRKTLEPILKNLGSSRREEAQTSVTNNQSLVTSAATSEVPTPDQILSLKICDIAVGSAAFLVETCRQLADVLVRAWRVHGGRPQLPPDETEELLAMRTIAQRCLYGVDRNPMAVDLAKLSLWLATLAKDHPFTFVDHAIRCGDSLVGLTRKQIETFSWKSEFTTGQLWENKVREYTAAALRERQILLGMGDDYGTPALKRARLEKADELLDYVRFIGDAAICAFFSADKDKAREAKRQEFIERLSDNNFSRRPIAEVKALRGEVFSGSQLSTLNHQHPVRPFHWEIEYPEVFDRENPGFDGIVGNPPFAGRTTAFRSNGPAYLDWLKTLHEGTHGNADLVAHFFRRAFGVIRLDGCFGLIATKTICQGDSRKTGLTWICTHDGVIYAARKRIKWPGQAAVIVSTLHICRCRSGASITPPYDLDGIFVPLITAYLFHTGTHENAGSLRENKSRSFLGSVVVGLGFTFDDEAVGDGANSITEMHRLIQTNPKNQECIFPYIGGQEINDMPEPEPNRYIINFGDKSEEDASQWPELLAIVKSKVKTEREGRLKNWSADKAKRAEKWWQHARPARDLYDTIKGLNLVLARSLTSVHFASFAFLKTGAVYDQTVLVFAFSTASAFAALSSRVHEEWALFQGGSMGETPRYNLEDCFEAFPFPAGFETNAALEAAGREYYEFRAALMVRNNEGLTKTYNRFHDPEEASPDILQLRALHAQMDTAVLTAYGWEDLLPQCACQFLLDYEDEEDAERGVHAASPSATASASELPDVSGSSALMRPEGRAPGRKKKPWRHRWPDEVRDEVLARLLKLNAERAEEEKIAGQAAAAAAPSKTKKARNKKSTDISSQTELIAPPQTDLF